MSFKIIKKDNHYNNLLVDNLVVKQELEGGSINGTINLNYVSGLTGGTPLQLSYSKLDNFVSLKINEVYTGYQTDSSLVVFNGLPDNLKPSSDTYTSGVFGQWGGVFTNSLIVNIINTGEVAFRNANGTLVTGDFTLFKGAQIVYTI